MFTYPILCHRLNASKSYISVTHFVVELIILDSLFLEHSMGRCTGLWGTALRFLTLVLSQVLGPCLTADLFCVCYSCRLLWKPFLKVISLLITNSAEMKELNCLWTAKVLSFQVSTQSVLFFVFRGWHLTSQGGQVVINSTGALCTCLLGFRCCILCDGYSWRRHLISILILLALFALGGTGWLKALDPALVYTGSAMSHALAGATATPGTRLALLRPSSGQLLTIQLMKKNLTFNSQDWRLHRNVPLNLLHLSCVLPSLRSSSCQQLSPLLNHDWWVILWIVSVFATKTRGFLSNWVIARKRVDLTLAMIFFSFEDKVQCRK